MSDNYDKVSLLLPMNGANNGTVFTDYSPVQKVVTAAGDAKTSTAQSKYYGSSGLFDGNGDVLTVPDQDAFRLGAGDFVTGGWVRFAGYGTQTNGTMDIISRDIINQRSWSFYVDGVANTSITALKFIGFVNNTTPTIISGSNAFSLSQWYFLSAARSGNLLFLGVDGTILNAGGTAFSITIQNASTQLHVGARNYDASNRYWLNGNMNDVFLVKGASSYAGIDFTANFTPPARRLGTISNSAVGASKILDINGSPAERTVIAVPRSAPVRVWSDVSDVNGEFEIWAPAGVDHSVVALADETGLRNDIVHRVIPV